MNTTEVIPEAVLATMRTFEALIRLEELRQRQLLGEIAEMTRWRAEPLLAREFRQLAQTGIEPRVQELKTLDRRLAGVRAKLTELRTRWGEPARVLVEDEAPGGPAVVPIPAEESLLNDPILSLVA